MKKIIILAIIMIGLTSCTDNQKARNWGGTETIKLNPNEVFVGSAWKEDHLWIETLDTVSGIAYMREKSSWGTLEGTIILKPNDGK